MKTGKLLLGIMATTAAGVAIGLLIAPDKGSTTRKQISQKGGNLLGNLKAKYEKIRLEAANDFEHLESEAYELLDKGKDKAYRAKNEIKHEAAELLSLGKEKVRETKNEIKNSAENLLEKS